MTDDPNDDLSARLQRVRGDGWPPAGAGAALRTRGDSRRRRRAAYAGGGLVVAAAAAVGLTAALGDGGSSTSGLPGGTLVTTSAQASGTPTSSGTIAVLPPPTSAGTTAGSSSSSPSPSSSGSASSTAASTPRCVTTQLSASITRGDPGAGQRYAFLELTNTGAACRIQGFGGVELRDAAGTVLAEQSRDRSAPSPLTELAPGAAVSSRLHWGVVPGTGDPQNGACSPGASVLVVTPPDETHPLQLAWTLGPVCGMRIDQQPYVPVQ
ncbi:uncharacterized protein DUF4232 [Motilibacter peucedani]|uniref:Uncharacterized protein DUF4232 n=1 Tax=Motilibacter peucedani TaxID=598650 RepID=A0A420XNZ2_9ACTN|nr:DUF4232 domain-containing protein [Motilibacter peucedani]RKS73895.1 uncharacterized protein DUF4232 [Motilibacter peucedani]